MLQSEGISKINEIKTFFQDNWLEPSVLHQQLRLIKFPQAKKIFKSVKTKGVDFQTVIELLIFLPMLGMRSINQAVKSNIEQTKKKDVYYRGLANQNIDWRQLLWSISKQYLSLSPDATGDKCLIFDDTEIEKTGKTIEGISKIHSHVSGRFLLGFKLLVAGYWDGEVLIPLDFSFHRESKNNKKNKYGLTKKERKSQHKTNRDNSSSSRKRYKELNMKKTEVIVEMFKRINKRKISVDYILIDSWFTTVSLIKNFLLVNKSVHVIGMYKYNSEVINQGKSIKIKQLKNGFQKLKRARKYGMYYRSFDVILDGLSVRLFIVRKGTNGAWHTILSTDKTLTFTKMMRKYSTRWSIEVFFKETKQLLNLGKNQSTNFDVQVAQTTITMIQYQMLSLKYRIEAYQTIGGMFTDIKQDIIENKLNERIIVVISEILTVLEYFVEGLDLELTLRKLIQYSDKFTFLNKTDCQNTYCKSAA
jgi:hypothetical protein